MKLTRATVARLGGMALPLLICPQAAPADSISDSVRRAIVRSAQIADQADSVWQQVAGEVVPAWQRPQELARSNIPQPFVEEGFAADLLTIALDAAAQCAGSSLAALEAKLPAARQEAVLLYQTAASAKPLFNEPFYGKTDGATTPLGTAVRVFPTALASAIDDGQPLSNSTVFGFEAYVRWRVLQEVLSDGRKPAEKAELLRCFQRRLGASLLEGPLRDVGTPAARQLRSTPRAQRPLRTAVDGCSALLSRMQRAGLFTSSSLTLSLGSGSDLFDEDDWQAGGSTSWQYILSGSVLVGGSQLAQDRTAATGQGAGLYPGMLLTAPLASYLAEAGVGARIDEYFLDNRVGRPDPRTFSDPRYYSDTLLEVLALEEPSVATPIR